MGLDQILGSITGATSADASAAASGAQPPKQHSMLESVMGLIQSPQVGGISGLMRMMHSKGLGDLIAGWVRTGPNPPITPAQVHNALGAEQVEQFAQQHGMTSEQASASLAQMLPQVVDQVTPQGSIPQEGADWSSALAALKSKFLQ
jgi:uncharacterized protein YidB (DUF937 family)